MKTITRSARRYWQTFAAVAFLTALPLVPLRATVDPGCGSKGCDCGGTKCQDTGGSKYQRWCSDGNGHCGCTIDTSC